MCFSRGAEEDFSFQKHFSAECLERLCDCLEGHLMGVLYTFPIEKVESKKGMFFYGGCPAHSKDLILDRLPQVS